MESYEGSEETTYLLDGCQRLSTICGALYWEPEGDPNAYWNLVYDLEEERFLHRADLEDPHPSVPLRLFPEPSAFFERIMGLPKPLRDRARTLFDRFTKYEVAVVTLHGTSLSEVGRIFERVNTRGTPLTTVEFVRAATWTSDFDLLDEIDRAGEHSPVSKRSGEPQAAAPSDLGSRRTGLRHGGHRALAICGTFCF